MLRVIFAGLCAAAISHGAAHAEHPQATGKWVIDFADDQCTAMHEFGTAKDPVHFVIKPSPASDVVQISLVKDGGNMDAVQEDARITIGDGAPAKFNQLRYGVNKKQVYRINLDASAAQALARARTLTWSAPRHQVQLTLGPMEQVMQTLAACRADLRKYWNIEPALQDSLRERATSAESLVRAFRSDDYPQQALWNSEGGTTSVVLLVDDNGELADCMIDQTSGIATLDAMTCIIIQKRAKFRPAIGSDGKPVRGVINTRIRWVMP